VDWDDMPRWRLIDKTLNLEIPEPAETYHTSPHLYTDLDIAQDATGTLPSAERTRVGLSAEKLEDIENKRSPRSKTRTRPAGGSRSDSGGRSDSHRSDSGSRSDSHRSDIGGRSDSARSEGPAKAAPDVERPSRQRTRRRHGEVPAEGGAADQKADASTPPQAASQRSGAPIGDGTDEAGGAPPRRRRRGGRGRGTGTAESAPSSSDEG
jgi:hypothetical protein